MSDFIENLKTNVPKPVPASTKHKFDEGTAEMVERLAALALSKSAVALGAGIQVGVLDRYYIEHYHKGQTRMQAEVAEAAMQQVKKGNPAMIMFIAKSRLGWTETNVVEHVGEVKAIVSSRPLTKEEFAERYLASDENIVDAEVIVDEGKKPLSLEEGLRNNIGEAAASASVSSVSDLQSTDDTLHKSDLE